ncbi:MAG: DUF2089 family protein [Anaerolineales bacterium]|nr:DUF2089 family protein [Anaerolineales bacterium]
MVGKFELSPFFRLSPDSLRFFRGIRAQSRQCQRDGTRNGRSYWAIRRQLDEVITEMGFEESPKEDDLSTRRQEILARLSRGEINVQEATKLLAQIKGDPS